MLLYMSVILFYSGLLQAQNIYKNGKKKSPFQPPANDDYQWSQTVKDIKVEETTLRVTTGITPATKEDDSASTVRERSPFSPPVKSEWHTFEERPAQPSAWLSSLEARQQHNTDSIPDIANIDLNKEHHKKKVEDSITNKDLSKEHHIKKVEDSIPDIANVDLNKEHHKKKVEEQPVTESRRPKLRAKRPKISVYHRDIHDTMPGVTPWTRYTEKPKTAEENSWSNSWSNGKTYAQCGYQSYSPRTQICCQGQVLRRQGIQPSCCGNKSFDTLFNKCCNGVVSLRSSQQTDC